MWQIWTDLVIKTLRFKLKYEKSIKYAKKRHFSDVFCQKWKWPHPCSSSTSSTFIYVMYDHQIQLTFQYYEWTRMRTLSFKTETVSKSSYKYDKTSCEDFSNLAWLNDASTRYMCIVLSKTVHIYVAEAFYFPISN